ncbi:MAG: sigma-70 family RNA polymerase sigma factor [Planctomycetes bacterium]|jgi:RNA polymerase sigma-70 factor (ECF subfamily)|nr:sigma-70 family RNA polymerase sigma factor [Planctomycetota bacterium]
MIRAREDRWFDRFRRTGDARALAKVFDRTAPELWRVAVHLRRDTQAAEDAVQGAFLAAIEAREQWDATRPLLPWLLGLLANRVREDRRRAARVLDAERLARTIERDPAELAEHEEFGAAFQIALQRVAEPYREVVERHLVHGLAAHELAAELGVPAGTVRMRLHRGLDQLRQKLPQGFVAGGLAVAVLSTDSFAAMRQVVLSKVPGGGAVMVTGGSVGVGVVGALLMKKAMLAAVACAFLALGIWAVWPAANAAGGAFPTADKVAAAHALVSDPAPLGNATEAASVPERRGVVPDAPATGTLRLVLRNAGNQQPVAGEQVQVRAESASRPVHEHNSQSGSAMPAHSTATRGSLELQDGTSDAEGVVTFAVPAGHVQVTVNQILDAPIELDIPANVVTERVIDLPVRIEADVLVVDAAGRAVADARIVGRADFYLGARDEVELGRTGVDGHWRAPFVERSVLVRALVDGLASSPGVLLLPSKGTTELRLGGPAATLSGVVLDQDGRPVGGAHLAIRPQAKKWDGSVPIMVLAEKSGRFECAHVPPGPCTVTAWFALVPGQNRFAMATAEATANAVSDVEVRFGRGARVVATLHRPQGTPWQSFTISAVPKLRVGAGVDMVRQVRTDARGQGTIDGLMPGVYELSADVENETTTEVVELREGQEYEFTRVLGGSAWIELHVVDAEKRSLVGWTAKLHARDASVPWARPVAEAKVDAKGFVRFERLPSQTFLVSVLKEARGLSSVQQEVQPNVRTEIVVASAQMPNAKLRGSVAIPEGCTAADLRISVARFEVRDGRPPIPSEQLEDPVGPDGRFLFSNLPAGTYHLAILRRSGNELIGMVGLRLGIEVAVGADVDLGLLSIGTTTLRCSVQRADGVAVIRPRLLVGFGKISSPMSRGELRDGAIEVNDLPPGTYDAFVWGENIAPIATSVTLRAGEALDLPIMAPAAIATTFRFLGLPPGANVGHVTVSQAGVTIVSEMTYESDATYVRGLSPGSYRIEFESLFASTTFRGAADFSVVTTSGAPIEVRVAK